MPVPPAEAVAWGRSRPVLLLAATATAAVEGISAAGATPASRRATAAADAELVVHGPLGPRPHALPPLPAGVSPALISHVVLERLGLLERLQVVDLGCAVAPAVPHLRLPALEGAGPARCVSSGRALPLQRVRALLQRGRRWGERSAPDCPLLLAECVPGGTTTALGVLRGLGVAADGLVSGSLLHSDHPLKARLVGQGLARAALGDAGVAGGAVGGAVGSGTDPLAVLAAVGDPMQPLAAGLALAFARRGGTVLLAGGSQMAAVLALVLALAAPRERLGLVARITVATTAWVADEPGSDLALLLQRLGHRWQVVPQLAPAGLRFSACRSAALRDYERGYVKEGVGAGGLAVLWEQLGHSPEALAQACDLACQQLLGG
ncbi:nicotinate mononucleotide-dependent phosphoribosyltransferase CobT [Cyanobium sp. LEGE 06113]|uniref:nicotinate mononucleotide-dependent phosphoribosyltransferase CobT n=1 Tax=Cyanobium sp. LEGE 06113 TaxID=1297573 RepID=UPI00187EF2DD|nr:TIGR00303 family protein [Cyanobium sp. LEGE 06113]MBE9152703.1 TIGR00303 family protein [Cyanobium sp. LEGE 06113]MBE9153092.1 TIGR00303 family protein [Cyanobium sp. LEGE 06113]